MRNFLLKPRTLLKFENTRSYINMFKVKQQTLIIKRAFNFMFLFTAHLVCFQVCMKATFIEGLKGILLFLLWKNLRKAVFLL